VRKKTTLFRALYALLKCVFAAGFIAGEVAEWLKALVC
jgi:hypothetical protein